MMLRYPTKKTVQQKADAHDQQEWGQANTYHLSLLTINFLIDYLRSLASWRSRIALSSGPLGFLLILEPL